MRSKRSRDFFVDGELAGVDDAHIHAGADGVVEEGGMDGFADDVVAAEGEGDIADAAGDFAERQCLFDLACSLDEVEGVAIVFLDAGADGENVRIENDVAAEKADFFGEELVGAAADGEFVIDFGRLAGFVEGHDHDGGAVTMGEAGVVQERFFAFLEADGINDGFALHALQTGFDDGPFRAVDHDGDASDFGLGGQQVEKLGHDGFAVEQGFVEIDVENIGATLDLAACDAEGLFEFAFFDEAGEFFAAGDVGALADHDEV